MSWMSRVFSKATAAWLASEVTSSSSTEVNGMTVSSTSETGCRTALRVALLVDELDDADDLVLVVAHGHDQHRLGPVARLLVEGAADLEGRARRAGGRRRPR